MRQILDFTHANLAQADFPRQKNLRPKDQMMDGFICANILHMYFSGCQFGDHMFQNDIGFSIVSKNRELP